VSLVRLVYAQTCANGLIAHFAQLCARLLRTPPRELGARPTPSTEDNGRE